MRNLRALGVLKPLALEEFGLDKVRMAGRYMIGEAARNTTLLCRFVPWDYGQVIEIIRAATGWSDYSLYEWMQSGERALNMARVFNVREGLSADDDWLPARSFEPAANGPLQNRAVEAGPLREAIHAYYGIMGWDPDTGVPTRGKLQQLGLEWAELL